MFCIQTFDKFDALMEINIKCHTYMIYYLLLEVIKKYQLPESWVRILGRIDFLNKYFHFFE